MSPAAPHPSLSRREMAIEQRNLHVYLPLNEEDALTSRADRSPSPSLISGRGSCERVGVMGCPRCPTGRFLHTPSREVPLRNAQLDPAPGLHGQPVPFVGRGAVGAGSNCAFRRGTSL